MSRALDWERARQRDSARRAAQTEPTKRQTDLLRRLCGEQGLSYVKPASREHASEQITDLLQRARARRGTAASGSSTGPTRSSGARGEEAKASPG